VRIVSLQCSAIPVLSRTGFPQTNAVTPQSFGGAVLWKSGGERWISAPEQYHYNPDMVKPLLLVLAAAAILVAADVPRTLTYGTLEAGGKRTPIVWDMRGLGLWHLQRDGTLIGQRDVVNYGPRKQWFDSQRAWRAWNDQQAWIYTKDEFGDFDLRFEYWLRSGGNSGVAVWDPTRGEAGIADPPDFRKTPSRVAYEIQLANEYPDPQPTGSIYGVAKAETGAHVDNEWNTMEIEGRSDMLRIRINGKPVAQHATLPDRPKRGPIGLQLHDQYSVMMIRNLRLVDRAARTR
jgi:hypothetical protein